MGKTWGSKFRSGHFGETCRIVHTHMYSMQAAQLLFAAEPESLPRYSGCVRTVSGDAWTAGQPG